MITRRYSIDVLMRIIDLSRIQIHRRMVENNGRSSRTDQAEDEHHKVSDKKSQIAAEAEGRTRRGSTRRRLRTIAHRKSGLHTKNRREESVSS